MTSQSKATSSVPRDAVRETLNRVLSSEVFQRSERSRTLLRFVVEQTLGGQTNTLKEYTLGTEALGKGPAFDPRTDPIVRSEVSRLRTRLDKYYATEGQSDAVVIVLPKGSYVPRFERRTIASGSTVGVMGEWPRLAFRRRAPLAIAAAALVSLIALFAYREFASVNLPQRVVTERAAGASEASAVSIAVLPFLNLSGDPAEEFFSDGMTEEITAALTKVPDLKVVARTSAFEYKGQNRNVQAIGRSLGATHVIEGSVRRDGDRVRITAQLIQADDGLHVWAESYDREFSDVFAIQEDIARSIAGALRIPLDLPQLVSSRTGDVGIYEQYLRAKILFNSRASGSHEEVRAVIARDPGFAPGWALSAELHMAALATATRGSIPEEPSDEMRRSLGWAPGRQGAIAEEESGRAVAFLLDSAETAAKKAIELDPSLPSGYALLGSIQARRQNWSAAEDLTLRALERDPDNPAGLYEYGLILAGAGRLKDALPIRVQLQTLEPFVPIYNIGNANIMRFAGQSAAGIAIIEAISPSTTVTYNRNVYLATAYAAQGQYARAADTLLLIRAQVPREAVEDAAQLLRSAPKKVHAPAGLPTFNNELNFVYAHVGAIERVMEYYEYGLRLGNVQGAYRLWDPVYAPLRKTDRFKRFVRDVGLVGYWRARGWPGLCRPTSADDFVCD
jgi:adenylate cyclase